MFEVNKDLTFTILKKEFIKIKDLQIIQNDKDSYKQFKKSVKILFIKSKKNKIQNYKIFILIKRIFKILINNEKEFYNYNENSIFSSIFYIILKQTFKLKISKFLKFNLNINLIEWNDILNILYYNLYLEKINFKGNN